jgi:hypothetical protein
MVVLLIGIIKPMLIGVFVLVVMFGSPMVKEQFSDPIPWGCTGGSSSGSICRNPDRPCDAAKLRVPTVKDR